jgi:diguanylate cyclase (GGDEF)-like protein
VFDLRTISIAITLVNILLAIITVNYWRLQKPFQGFGYWTLGNVSAAVAFLLLGLRGVIPSFFSIVLANCAILLVSILQLEAIRTFYGQNKVYRWHPYAMTFLFLESLYFSEVFDSPVIRVVTISIIVSINGILFLRTLIKYSTPKQHFLPYLLGILYSFYVLILTIRAYSWWTNPIERAILSPTSINTIFFFYDLVSMIGTTITFILMNNQRLGEELHQTHKILETMATSDSLTNARNRGAFYEYGNQMMDQARLDMHSISIILLDFDHFKNINDTFGHAAGDLVLRDSSDIIRSHIRERDMIGRIGGDEFGICLPETDMQGALEVAQRIRQSIGSYRFEWQGTPFTVSISLGVSEYQPSDPGFDTLMIRADQHLLEAKREGRNRVVTDLVSAPA